MVGRGWRRRLAPILLVASEGEPLAPGASRRDAQFRNIDGNELASRLRRRYCAAILLHCASAACLSEAIGMFAAAVRQACFALLSAVLTFVLLVVI